MKFKELIDDLYIKNWLSGIGAKKTTREGYIDSLRAYTEFLDKPPEQIIKESEDDISSGKLMRERKIFNELREFREYLEGSGIAPMSIKAKLTGVRSFFNYYNIILPVLPRSATCARPLMENRAIPTKEDIRESLIVADPIEKALVLIGVSSGLAINEISNLKVDEFFKGYDTSSQITTLHLIREKVGYEFYTFLTPEASRAVLEYLEYRNRTSDSKDRIRQNQLLKQRVKYDKRGSPIGYLFVGRAIPNEYLEEKNEKKAEELRKLNPKSIQKIYRELSEKSRKSSPAGKRNLVRSHNIRKFFNSTLLANRAELFFTDFLMGHQIDGTRDAYYRADPKALREEYKKYVPYLTIQKALDISESPEYQQIKKENQILQVETARHIVERSELQEVREELSKIKEMNDVKSVVSKEFFATALMDSEVQLLIKNLLKTP
jgi:integrase